jgi:hypothetical protein
VVLGTLTVVSFQNCGKFKPEFADSSLSSESTTPPPGISFAQINSQVIQPFCVTCHSAGNTTTGGGYDYSSYAKVLGSTPAQTVVPNSPSTSTFYTDCTSGKMPLGGAPISSTLASMIQQWIQNGAPQFAAPGVSAGANQSVTLPQSGPLVLTGSVTPSDSTVTISSYNWTQVSGPNTATLANATTVSVSITGLVAGTYVFQLAATDSNGQTGSAQVTVTAN